MSLLLFSLRGVPEDEAEEVRELLTSNRIEFYETSAGLWGTSTPALWLLQEEQFPKIGKNVFIAPTASVVGDVEIGDGASIWYGTVVRGDSNFLKIQIC